MAQPRCLHYLQGTTLPPLPARCLSKCPAPDTFLLSDTRGRNQDYPLRKCATAIPRYEHIWMK
ncbi:hypothetical protein C2845_PM07G18450 [Panicum miliaceum]|uniref:Uncharacterized protein n=1 Tax=Panicum miliaceum TaxID=4540 RepID=A0A3L6SQ91_PANMI|nr:hypothetical protein C2845_PM07G18450 [Panicum miliaceum]